MTVDEPKSKPVGEDTTHLVTADFQTVRERELDEIVQRREVARRPDAGREETRASLVGLSLSGGGLRAAAFSLGVLQGLYRYGVLRFIDYMSTVSGGGYAGAYLSSVVLQMLLRIGEQPVRSHP